ncbi:MAG: hypothetical protein ACLQBB_13425 [Solirubrobacteraceae bacterium]
MTANIAFSLCAAVISLLVVVLAGIKGDWAVVAVYALLLLGFLARASFGRRDRRLAAERDRPPAPSPARRVKPARFRRR